EQGFTVVRIARPDALLGARDTAHAALAAGRLAAMAWMTDEWLTRATDPGTFLAGARSVLLLALPYRGGAAPPAAPTEGTEPDALPLSRGRVARYAQGRDYHRVFESKLRRIAGHIREESGAEARSTVDYGPLLERPFAAAAGMGWLGKSTMLLVPGLGPWVLLGAVATTLELAPDAPLQKSCGSCTRCVVACPTGALGSEGNVLDARLCISYHTIENRGSIPRELRSKFADWVFGCDACLDSCPVGAGNTAAHPDFRPADIEASRPSLSGLLALDGEAFRARFQGRAIMRAKRDGLVRNAAVALGNVGSSGDLDALIAALADPSPVVREHVAWGIGRLAARHGLQSAALAALENQLRTEDYPAVRAELLASCAELAAPA
ncbi:MAG: tRNA epoxyqueuosine(34) reductase QueG, partial [Tepidiformaceae bacterium]